MYKAMQYERETVVFVSWDHCDPPRQLRSRPQLILMKKLYSSKLKLDLEEEGGKSFFFALIQKSNVSWLTDERRTTATFCQQTQYKK